MVKPPFVDAYTPHLNKVLYRFLALYPTLLRLYSALLNSTQPTGLKTSELHLYFRNMSNLLETYWVMLMFTFCNSKFLYEIFFDFFGGISQIPQWNSSTLSHHPCSEHFSDGCYLFFSTTHKMFQKGHLGHSDQSSESSALKKKHTLRCQISKLDLIPIGNYGSPIRGCLGCLNATF